MGHNIRPTDINFEVWDYVCDNSPLIKIYYNQALPIWNKIEPLSIQINNLHDVYDEMEEEYFNPPGPESETSSTSTTNKVTKDELISMINKINSLSVTCNEYINEGRPIAIKMWEIYMAIINTEAFDSVRNDPDVWLINQEVKKLYENYLNTTLKPIGHWTDSGAIWIISE